MKRNHGSRKITQLKANNQADPSAQWLYALGRMIARVHLTRLQKSAGQRLGDEMGKKKGENVENIP